MKKGFVLATLLAAVMNGQAQTVDTTASELNDSTTTEVIRLNSTTHLRAETGPDEVYKLNPKVDIPLTAVGVGWSVYAFSKIYNKDKSTEAEILALRREDLAFYNRFGADSYHPKAADASDHLFYGSMPLPLFLLLDKEIRKDAGKVGLMFLESMAVTGLLYTGSVYFVDKYRPYTYNPETPMDKRMGGGGKNSFFAGHVALVGTSTFFTAKVLSDYHPHSRAKWAFFTGAGIATASTAYLRYRAGQHFLDDLVIGSAVGTLSGILVPRFHKNRTPKSTGVSLSPQFGLGGQKGVAMVYRF